jgi:hypothetical protein
VASLFPGGAEGTNLGGLLDMKRLTGLIEFEGPVVALRIRALFFRDLMTKGILFT